MGEPAGGIVRLRELVDENPEWESDLLALYGYDITDALVGRAPIWQALALIKRLAFEPMSMWRARELGGMEYMGWSGDSDRLADIIDHLQVNTVITGHIGASGKPEFPEPYARPDKVIEMKGKEEPTPTGVESFDIFAAMSQIGGEIGGTSD